MLPLTIGILSWGAQKTLRNTLESYRDKGLLDLAAQVFVFFQEMTPQDIAVAAEFKINWDGIPNVNLGIAGGYRKMLQYIEQPYYLFLENDWVLNADPKEPIEQGYKLLKTRSIDVIRYRHRQNPGNPLWTRQFEGNELVSPQHLLDSVHWLDNPASKYPEYIQEVYGTDWFLASASNANWTNNPHMVRTEWVRQIADKMGERDIERDLQDWWQQQKFIVAQGNGLFTHWRIG